MISNSTALRFISQMHFHSVFNLLFIIENIFSSLDWLGSSLRSSLFTLVSLVILTSIRSIGIWQWIKAFFQRVWTNVESHFAVSHVLFYILPILLKIHMCSNAGLNPYMVYPHFLTHIVMNAKFPEQSNLTDLFHMFVFSEVQGILDRNASYDFSSLVRISRK